MILPLNCKEFELEDVMAITAVPVSAFSIQTVATLPARVTSQQFSVTSYDGVIVIGVQPAVAGGALIPIIRTTGKAKDDESDSVAGRSHQVNVTCQVDDRESETWLTLQRLERGPYCLILHFRRGGRGIVVADRDTYRCTVERNGSKTEVSFRIHNLTGLQIVA